MLPSAPASVLGQRSKFRRALAASSGTGTDGRGHGQPPSTPPVTSNYEPYSDVPTKPTKPRPRRALAWSRPSLALRYQVGTEDDRCSLTAPWVLRASSAGGEFGHRHRGSRPWSATEYPPVTSNYEPYSDVPTKPTKPRPWRALAWSRPLLALRYQVGTEGDRCSLTAPWVLPSFERWRRVRAPAPRVEAMASHRVLPPSPATTSPIATYRQNRRNLDPGERWPGAGRRWH